MRVFNEDKTTELDDYDLALGYLVEDELITHHEAVIVHHDAIEGVEEQGHYETVAEYPNGGKDIEWVVDVAKAEAKEAYDEVISEAYDSYEPINLYIPYSEAKKREISLRNEMYDCNEWLRAHDYIGTKIATGRASVSEYADIIAEMQSKADRINEIEAELAQLNAD